MAKGSEETKSKVNWTAIGVGVIVLGAGTILYKIVQTLTGPSPAAQKEIDKLLVQWQAEFDVLKPFVESIYAPGHTPTDQEIATLNSMEQNMQTKEQTINNISSSGWDHITPVIKQIGSTAWQITLSVAVAGFAIITMVWLFKKIRRPPSSWNCPKDGKPFGSAEELGTHIRDAHLIVLQNAAQAQQDFNQTTAWIQNAVAVQSGYYGYTFADWKSYNASELQAMAVAGAIVWAAGAAAAADAALLQVALAVLLA